MKRLLFSICFSIALLPYSFAQESEKVYSAGSSIVTGLLERVKVAYYGDQEVWGMARADNDFEFMDLFFGIHTPVVFINPLTEKPYYVTDQGVSEFFQYAQEGDYIEVEGVSLFVAWHYRFHPTRISTYNTSIEGKVGMKGNPAFTIPALPGVVFSIDMSDQRQFVIAGSCGEYSIPNDYDYCDIAGQSYPMSANVKVYGTVSQRWDLMGRSYLDIYPSNCYLLGQKPVASAEEIRVSFQNGRVEIQSNSPIEQIVAYELGGKCLFRESLASESYTYSFEPEKVSDIILLLIETQNSHMVKKIKIK